MPSPQVFNVINPNFALFVFASQRTLGPAVINCGVGEVVGLGATHCLVFGLYFDPGREHFVGSDTSANVDVAFGVVVVVILGVVGTTVPASPVIRKQSAFCEVVNDGFAQIAAAFVGVVTKFAFARQVASHAWLLLQESTQLFNFADAVSVGVLIGVFVGVLDGVVAILLGLGDGFGDEVATGLVVGRGVFATKPQSRKHPVSPLQPQGSLPYGPLANCRSSPVRCV